MSWLQRFVIVKPLSFALIIWMKDPFSAPLSLFFQNRPLLSQERRLVAMDIIYLKKSWWNETFILLLFNIFFKWRLIVDWNVWKISTDSFVHLNGLDSTNPLEASWLAFRFHLWTTQTKLWIPVSNLVFINDIWVINTKLFLMRICSIFFNVNLKQYYISNIHFQFLHF